MSSIKINFNQKLKSLEGKTMRDATGKKEKDLTLSTVCINALLAITESDKDLPGTDKLERYDFAMRIKASSKLELKAEELTLLKELIGKVYPTWTVGQSYHLLEGK